MYNWLADRKKIASGGLLTGIRKKEFARSISAYQVPGDVLFYSSDKTASGIAAVIGVTT